MLGYLAVISHLFANVFCRFSSLNLVSTECQRQSQEVSEGYGWDQGGRGHSLLLYRLNSDTKLFPLALFCPW